MKMMSKSRLLKVKIADCSKNVQEEKKQNKKSWFDFSTFLSVLLTDY